MMERCVSLRIIKLMKDSSASGTTPATVGGGGEAAACSAGPAFRSGLEVAADVLP